MIELIDSLPPFRRLSAVTASKIADLCVSPQASQCLPGSLLHETICAQYSIAQNVKWEIHD